MDCEGTIYVISHHCFSSAYGVVVGVGVAVGVGVVVGVGVAVGVGVGVSVSNGRGNIG